MAMENTDLVVFHAKNLTLTSISVLDANQEMGIKEQKTWEPWDQVALRLHTALEVSRCISVPSFIHTTTSPSCVPCRGAGTTA